MAIQVRQTSSVAEGSGTQTATFSSPPLSSSLVVAFMVCRANLDADPAPTFSSGVTTHTPPTLNMGSGGNRAMAFGSRTGSTSTTVAGSWASNTVKLVAVEIEATAGETFTFVDAASQLHSPMGVTGETSGAADAAGHDLYAVLGLCFIKNGGNENISALTWSDGMSPAAFSNGGNFGRTLAVGFLSDATGGTLSVSPSFTTDQIADGHTNGEGGIVGIAVFGGGATGSGATVEPATVATATAISAPTVTVPPPQVTGLSAVIADNDVTLTWNAASSATHYDIERDGVTLTRVTGVTTYVDSDLTPGSYTYRVRGVIPGG